MIKRNALFRIFSIFLATVFAFSYASYGQYEQYYEEAPNISGCEAGVLKQSEKDKVLTLLNRIRNLHDLPPFEYDSQFDDEAAEISLIIVANFADHGFSQQNHQPPQSWHCWSQTGYDGGTSSNLFYGGGTRTSETSVISWLNDRGVNVLGHRRWILDPFVKYIAFGRADGVPINGSNTISGMAFYYDADREANISSLDNDYVAFPYGDYPPSYYDHGWSVMSFTAIGDRSSRWANNSDVVSYKSTIDGEVVNEVKVEVEDESGHVEEFTPESGLGWDYGGYGIPNCLIWQMRNLNEQETYQVRVYDVRINGQNRDFSYEFTLTDPFITKPNSPSLQAPPNEATEVNPNATFEWSVIGNADEYILQISETGEFSEDDIIYENLSISEEEVTVSGVLEPKTTYYWRVAGSNNAGSGEWSPIWSFTTTTAPDSPTLAGPADGESNVSLGPTLNWNSTEKADSYDLQISESEDFNSTVVDTQNIDGTTCEIEQGTLAPETEHYWRVRAFSDVSGYSAWSSAWSFTTAAAAPGAPDLLSPPQGAEDQNAQLTLRWENIPGASSYDIQISEDVRYPEWAIMVDTNVAGKNTLRVPPGALDLLSRYFWRVRSIGPGGESDWSRNGRFATGDASSVEKEHTSIAQVSVYPNPTNQATNIHMTLEAWDNIDLSIYNSAGEKVQTLIDGETAPGDYILKNIGGALPSGVYYYKLSGAKVYESGKIFIIR